MRGLCGGVFALSCVLCALALAAPVAGAMAATVEPEAAAIQATAATPAAAEPCPARVRVSLPNFEIAPYVLGTDEVASKPGLLIEWTRNALQAAGCRASISIKRRPPNRQLAELEMGLLDILPGFSYSDNPDDQLVYPMFDGAADERRAIMADTVSLYARSGDSAVRWDGFTLRHPGGVVGTSTGGASTELVARRYGWKLESAPTPRADLDKLLAGRVDVIMEPDVVMTGYLTGETAAKVVKLSPPARVTFRYAAVRKGFAQQYPAFTEKFWRELCLQARSGGGQLPACR